MEAPEGPLATERLLRRMFRLSGCLMVVLFLGLFAGFWGLYSPDHDWIGIGFLGASGLCVLSGLALGVHSTFVRSRIRLVEVIATVWVAAALLGLLLSCRDMRLDEPAAVIGFGLLPTLAVGAGSVWGWRVAEQVGEQRTWPRLGLLACGWLAIPGALCAAGTVVLGLLIGLGMRTGIGWWSAMLPGCLLLAPAAEVERRMRAKRRSEGIGGG